MPDNACRKVNQQNGQESVDATSNAIFKCKNKLLSKDKCLTQNKCPKYDCEGVPEQLFHVEKTNKWVFAEESRCTFHFTGFDKSENL